MGCIRVQRIIFTNSKGESVTLGSGRPYILQFLNGTGGSETDVQMQKAPFQDGQTYIDTLLEPRELTFEVAIMCDTQEELYKRRADLVRVFNAKLGKGKLRYEYDGGVKEIDCVIDQAPVFPTGSGNKGSGYQRTSFSVICPSPFWTSTEITEEPTFEPLFQFPFEDEFEMGVQRDERIIFNDGDSKAPLQIQFYGPAVNPIIINQTTGEYIKVNQTLLENEVMEIDTTPGNKSVYFVEEDGTKRNVFNWIDLDSEFFQLAIGENIIEYSADSDIQGAIVNISYRKLYAGV